MRFGGIVATVVLSVQALTPLAFAGGVGSAPDSLEFSLTRDGYETRTIVLLAESVAGSTLAVTVTGPAREWVTVTPFGSPAPSSIVEIGPDGRVLVEVTVAIPGDAANGTYLAAVEVSTIVSAATIQTSIAVPITIEVTGDAIVAGSVERIVTPRTAPIGADILVTVTVRNTGSVKARPTVAITLSADQDVRARNTTEFPALRPGTSATLSTNIEALGSPGDQLTMEIAILLDSFEISRGSSTIELVAPGGARRSVAPLDVSVDEAAGPGGITRLVVSFTNDGPEPVAVAFVGSVSRDGAPIDAVKSIQIQAEPGETGVAEIFVTITRDGEYEITGRWEGDGVTSAPVAFGWNVGAPFPLSPLIAVFIVLTLLLGGATIRYWTQSVRQNDSEPSIKVGSSSR